MGEMKVCKCVVCGVDVEVSKFMAPAKVRCPEHSDVRVSTAHIAQANNGPIYLDEVAIELQSQMAEEVRSWGGDVAFCPRDPDHTVVIKSITNGPHGVVVTHQCRDCYTIICYSTQHHRELLPQGVREQARETTSVQWRESRLGTYPERDLRGILLGKEPNGPEDADGHK